MFGPMMIFTASDKINKLVQSWSVETSPKTWVILKAHIGGVRSYSCQAYFVQEREGHSMTQDGHYIVHHTFRFDSREGIVLLPSQGQASHPTPIVAVQAAPTKLGSL